MKLIVNHPVVGTFVWELPNNIAQRFADCGDMWESGGRESTHIGGGLKSAILDDQREKITAFLALIVTGFNMQKPGAIMEMIDVMLKEATIKATKIASE